MQINNYIQWWYLIIDEYRGSEGIWKAGDGVDWWTRQERRRGVCLDIQ
jgi:hypothetical protein